MQTKLLSCVYIYIYIYYINIHTYKHTHRYTYIYKTARMQKKCSNALVMRHLWQSWQMSQWKKNIQNDHETQHQVQQQQQSLQKRLQQCGHLLLTTKRTFVWNSFSRTRRMQSATALAKQQKQQQCEQTIYAALQHAELLWRCRGMMCDDHNVVDSATTATTTSAAFRWSGPSHQLAGSQ